MNKEQQELLDEVYETYTNYPLATIQDHHTNILYQNLYKGWCIRIGRSIVSPHPTRHLTKEEFINKCKTDTEFSERWGLKIEQRELNLEERAKWLQDNKGYDLLVGNLDHDHIREVVEEEAPTKLIKVTYNDKTIEMFLP
jgi:hypothetical protein